MSKQSYIGEKLFCGSCGRKMKRRVWSGKTYYMCPRNLESKGGCSTRSISEEKLKEAVLGDIQIEIGKAKAYRTKQLHFEQSTAYKIKRAHERDLLSKLRHQRNVLTARKSELFKKINAENTFTFQDYFLYKNYADDEIQEIDMKIALIEDSQRSYQENCSSEAIWVSQLLRVEREITLTEYMYNYVIDSVLIFENRVSIKYPSTMTE